MWMLFGCVRVCERGGNGNQIEDTEQRRIREKVAPNRKQPQRALTENA